jgi:hypothetical protein
MIDILDVQVIEGSRHVTIAIDNGGPTYLWRVGGLPLTGNLQTILDRRQGELFAVAQTRGQVFDLFDVRERAKFEALFLLLLDENNALRAAMIPPLPARTEAQLRAALREKARK